MIIFKQILPFLLLLIYLIYCSYSDIKNKSISLYISIISMLICIIQDIVLKDFTLTNFFISLIPGIVLLILSCIFSNSLGKGDGIIILICGIHIGVFFTLKILLIALLFSAFYSIFLLMRKHSLKDIFPFAPFILLSYIFNLLF